MTDAPLVRTTVAAGVATVTLDSPHNRNALSSALIGELVGALDEVVTDDRARVILITHSGPVFCSGADLKETAEAFASGTVPAARMGDLLATVWECPKPVVARVGGPARAGGLGLIAAADIAICARDATFAFTEVRLGVIPAIISATVLPRMVPRAAAELFLTGETFDGERAAQVGLVTAAVARDELEAATANYTNSLVRGAPAALAATKRLLHGPSTRSIRDELAELTAVSVGFFTSGEGREGVASFMEKRDPSWVPEG